MDSLGVVANAPEQPGRELPRVPGHEVRGRIVAKDAEVGAEQRLGQQVIVWPYTADGCCTSCRADRGYACRVKETLGAQQDGALLKRLVLPAAHVITEDALPPMLQAWVEPISVGFHAASRGRVASGEWVVVLGCGMIGIGAILAAAARGARVIAVDPIVGKQRAAIEMGAEIFTPLTGDALLAEIDRVTDGDGADVVIEAVGSPETFTLAIDAAAYCGRVVYVGYSKAHVTYDTRKFNLKELDILGCRNASRADFAAVIARPWRRAVHLLDDRLYRPTQRVRLHHRQIGHQRRRARVNGVAPGWIDTALFQQATRGDEARRDKIYGRIPMGRLGMPEDIGWARAFLAAPAARYITGQVLLVDDGGATGF